MISWLSIGTYLEQASKRRMDLTMMHGSLGCMDDGMSTRIYQEEEPCNLYRFGSHGRQYWHNNVIIV